MEPGQLQRPRLDKRGFRQWVSFQSPRLPGIEAVIAPVNIQHPTACYNSIPMRYSVSFLALVQLLLGCSNPTASLQSGSPQSADQQRNIGAPFSVNVQLSEPAREKLTDSKETIIVAGYFTGHPKEGTEARYLDIKSRDVNLGDVQQEIWPGQTAVFNQLNLDPDAVSRIDSRGPHILIDVFSGRKSSKDNLLDCEDYDEQFESLRGRTILIHCRLIAEHFPRLHK